MLQDQEIIWQISLWQLTLQSVCRVGQSAKTPLFHGGMTGSTPVRGTRFQVFFSSHFLLPATFPDFFALQAK